MNFEFLEHMPQSVKEEYSQRERAKYALSKLTYFQVRRMLRDYSPVKRAILQRLIDEMEKES